MPAGRPRKPVELKKLEGTYRADRDREQEQTQQIITSAPSVILPEGSKISVPKTIKSKYVKAYWRKLTASLIQLRVLSPNDIPQLEILCLTLEKLREAEQRFSEVELGDMETYEFLLKAVTKLTSQFNELAKNYYISPTARIKLRLDDLNLVKTAQEIQKNETAIGSLLAQRKARD